MEVERWLRVAWELAGQSFQGMFSRVMLCSQVAGEVPCRHPRFVLHTRGLAEMKAPPLRVGLSHRAAPHCELPHQEVVAAWEIPGAFVAWEAREVDQVWRGALVHRQEG